MANYNISNLAKEDLIRIHQYGIERFGIQRADAYFKSFFEQFKIITKRPFSFESVDHIKLRYRRCVCGSDSIYYKINNGSIEIMAIIGKQDLKNMF